MKTSAVLDEMSVAKSHDDLLEEEVAPGTIVTIYFQIEAQIDGETDDIVVNVNPQVE